MSFPCSIYRGGTSKGVLFLRDDLPRDEVELKRVLMRVMGSPDKRQIDGLGGGDPLTSRIGMIRMGERVEYQFALVHVEKAQVDISGSCGNLMTAVGLFAVQEGLVAATGDLTQVPILDVNTGMEAVVDVPTGDGVALLEGDFHIDGTPNPGPRIDLRFLYPDGLLTGKVLPTGNAVDTIGDLEVSLVDSMAPAVFVRAADLGLRGDEAPGELGSDVLERLESLRVEGAKMMGIEVNGYVPKVVFVAGRNARMMALGKMHKAFAVSTAVCTAKAAKLSGTVVDEVAGDEVVICHPAGQMEVRVCGDEVVVPRTARRLMRGTVYI